MHEFAPCGIAPDKRYDSIGSDPERESSNEGGVLIDGSLPIEPFE
jgi:hypothetical protein